MAIRKNRPVLYEVVRHARLREPGWSRRPITPSASVSGAASAAGGPAAEGSAASAAGGSATSAAGGVRVSGGRVQLLLGWPALVAAAVLVLFVGWVLFETGRRFERSHLSASAGIHSGATAGGDAITAGGLVTDATPAPSPPPGRDVSLVGSGDRAGALPPPQPAEEPRRPAPGPPPAGPAESATSLQEAFKAGYHYVVVQHFGKNGLEAAEDAGRFLKSKGVECVIYQRRGVDVELIAREPFLLNQKDAAAAAAEKRRCDELKATIRKLGKEYSSLRQPGYAFDQCYERVIRASRR